MTKPIGTSQAWLSRHQKSVGVARSLLREFLADIESGQLFLGVGELVASELVNNAVQHARVPGRLIFVRFDMEPGLLRIEVHDASRRIPTMRTAGDEDESGRGLQLVDQLAKEWGVSPREGVGKAVWALVAPADEGCAVSTDQTAQHQQEAEESAR
ncbi:ATP-binding protein [Kitasatospora sp. NPDC101155]|uniref:ATP-binding protein n=1 Tax=Kitasatospora sp. NPDC101155 TaxID=3364097 RepID=UPI00381316DF